MKITENTVLSEILKEYPALEPKLLALDPRFRVISTGIGKHLLKKNTIKSASKIVGVPVPDILRELNKMIESLDKTEA